MRWEFSRKVGEPMKSQFDIGESKMNWDEVTLKDAVLMLK